MRNGECTCSVQGQAATRGRYWEYTHTLGSCGEDKKAAWQFILNKPSAITGSAGGEYPWREDKAEKNNIYCVLSDYRDPTEEDSSREKTLRCFKERKKKNKKHPAETVTDIQNIGLAAFEGVTREKRRFILWRKTFFLTSNSHCCFFQLLLRRCFGVCVEDELQTCYWMSQ